MKYEPSKPPVASHTSRRTTSAAPEAKPTTPSPRASATRSPYPPDQPTPSQCTSPPRVLTSSRPGSVTSACHAPQPACASAAARKASRQPDAGTASGFKKNSSGADVAAAPALHPPANPTFCSNRNTGPPPGESDEALSTISSSSPSRSCGCSAASVPGRCAAD